MYKAIAKKKDKAFTLIELLVVISIIAVLMSILIPSLSMARAQAQKVVCTSNLRNMGLATSLYLEDYDGRYPAPQGVWSYGWYQSLAPYASTEKDNLERGADKTYNIFACPSSKSKLRQPFRDYAAAWWTGQTTQRYGIIGYRAPYGSTGKKNFYSRRQMHIKRDNARVVWLSEYPNDQGGTGDTFVYTDQNKGYRDGSEQFLSQFGGRHKGDNALMVDTHVEFRDESDTKFERDDFSVF
ncbi:MAG: type II secretion system protein [Sedimentisphaeraceae bacterium JB056]